MSGQHDELQRPQHLMMAALDGEISEQEREELGRILEGDAALRREWTQLERVKEVTSTMVLGEPPEEIWDDYWRIGVYRRIERGVRRAARETTLLGNPGMATTFPDIMAR